MISEFRGEHRFLSNFHPAEVILDGVTYPSVEHAYQAAKTLDQEMRMAIRNLKRAGDAKKFGGDRNNVTLRLGWEDTKLDVMTELVVQKFLKHSELGDKLLATGDEELVEGNWWGDTFWGVCRGQGENHLGKILMQVRSLLRDKRG